MALDIDALLRQLDAATPASSAVAGARRQADAAAYSTRRRAGALSGALLAARTGAAGAPGAAPASASFGKVIGVPGSSRAAAVVRAAMGFRGTPYVWGGTTKAGIDCSGLVYAAARAAGIPVSRLRASGWGQMGSAVSAPGAKPGDLVYFNNPGATDHIGIYVGGGRFLEAQQSGTRVMVSPVRSGAQYRRVF